MTRSFATASLLTGAWVLVVAGPFQAAAQSPQPPKPGCSLPRFDPPDPARSRGIRFEGGAQSASGASFTAGAMSEPVTEDGVTFRKLLAGRVLDVDLPAFDVDGDGLPTGPMVLEIRYRDDWARPRVAVVRSRIEGPRGDGDLAAGNREFDNLGGLGDRGDGTWKVYRFPLARTAFPLVRAVRGAFRFVLRDAPKDLPIESITLRSVTPSQIDALQQASRTCLGYRRVALPPDVARRSPPRAALGLTVFLRDPMRPVFAGTRPSRREVASVIDVSSAPGEIEPVAVGLYSETGIDGLEVRVSDLARVGGGAAIPASAIEVARVVEADRRLAPYVLPGVNAAWARVPDYLDGFATLSLDPRSSVRVWLKIHVPRDLQGGTHAGQVRILRQGRLLKTLALRVDVLLIALDPPAHLNPIYTDPYMMRVTNRPEEAFRVFRETGAEPFLWEADGDVRTTRDADGRFAFDTAQLDRKMAAMSAAGIVGRPVMLMIWKARGDIEQALFGHATGPDLYRDLSDPRFVEAFGEFIRRMTAVAARYGTRFLFNCADEPGEHAVYRVLCDRLDTIIRANGGSTSVTYAMELQRPLPGGAFEVPGGRIPPLDALVDFKVWAPQHQDAGFAQHQAGFGYYTTNTSYLWDPVYNRFLHGLLAVATDATVVSSYALGTMVADPYDDFDRAADNIPFPDFLLAYPTSGGRLLDRLALEGLREGIKDAKYVATLRRRIAAAPQAPVAREAAAYLSSLKASIDPNFWQDYVLKSTDTGFQPTVLGNVSPDRRGDDYEAFTKVRAKLFGFLKRMGRRRLPPGG